MNKNLLPVMFLVSLLVACNTSSIEAPEAPSDNTKGMETSKMPASPLITDEPSSPVNEVEGSSTQTENLGKSNILGVIDCDLLDIEKIDGYFDFHYKLIAEDQDGCIFLDKETRSYLTILPGIHGTKQMSVDAAHSEFDHLLAVAYYPHADEWESTYTEWTIYNEGFKLGVASVFGNTDNSVVGGVFEAYGVLSNGYAVYIHGNNIDPTTASNYDAARDAAVEMVEEIARQLNRHW